MSEYFESPILKLEEKSATYGAADWAALSLKKQTQSTTAKTIIKRFILLILKVKKKVAVSAGLDGETVSVYKPTILKNHFIVFEPFFLGSK